MSFACSRCGADVQKRLIAGVPVYRHAVPNFDHAPMPTTAPAPRSRLDSAQPPVRVDATVPNPVVRRGGPTALGTSLSRQGREP